MHTMIKGLLKFLLFLLSLLVLIALALVIYLSNPKMLNSTLPFLLATENIHYEQRWQQSDAPIDLTTTQTQQATPGTLVYVQALSAEEFAARYQLPVMSINEVYVYLSQKGYRLKSHWDAQQNILAEPPQHDTGPPSFSDPILFGNQLLFVEQFPNACLDLLISYQKWFSYFLVLEFAACHE